MEATKEKDFFFDCFKVFQQLLLDSIGWQKEAHHVIIVVAGNSSHLKKISLFIAVFHLAYLMLFLGHSE